MNEARTDPPPGAEAAGATTELALAAGGSDPRVGLRGVVALRRLLETLEVLQVGRARRQGWSWQEIADALGVSKQAVHKKHSGRWPDQRER